MLGAQPINDIVKVLMLVLKLNQLFTQRFNIVHGLWNPFVNFLNIPDNSLFDKRNQLS
jgi:hypothetical protein